MTLYIESKGLDVESTQGVYIATTMKMSFDTSLWEKLQAEERASREAKRIETLERAIGQLRRYFSHKKVAQVFLFGSILRENAFYDFSDIDIGVVGLHDSYFRTLCELEELLDREVDLIELEGSKLKAFEEQKGMQIK